MSREHFHESQIEDRVTQLMEEGMSDEDAIQKAESEYDGQVNLVEEQALKINKRQNSDTIFQCWQCKSILHTSDLDGEDCPFCCTDIMLMDIDTLTEDREDR